MTKRTSFLFLVFLFFLFTLLATTSCDQVSALKNYFSKDKTAAPKKSEIVPPTPKSPSVSLPPDDTQNQADSADEPSADIKKVVSSPTPVAPVSPQVSPADASFLIKFLDHFAGEVTSFDGDTKYLYVGFGRKLVVYDLQLGFVGSMNTETNIQKVVVKSSSQNLLIQEANHHLEVFSFFSTPTTGIFKMLKNLQFDGPVEVFPSLVVVLLKDKIQILDINEVGESHVTGEIPLLGVTQVVPYLQFLYVVSGNDLNVVDLKTNEVRATISIGTSFQILGVRSELKTSGDELKTSGEWLALALQATDKKGWSGISFLPLIAGGGGVAGTGTRTDLTEVADRLQWDDDFPFLSLFRQGKIFFFDPNSRKELNAAAPPISPLHFLRVVGKNIFAVGEGEIGRFDYQVPEGVVASTPGSAAPPLAVPSSGSSIVWDHPKTISFPSQVDSLVLVDDDHALFLKGDSPNPLFYSTNFSVNSAQLTSLHLPIKEEVSLRPIRSVGNGILLEEKEGARRLFWVKADFSATSEIHAESKNLVARDIFFDGKSYTLAQIFVDPSKTATTLTLNSLDPEKGLLLKSLGTVLLPGGGGLKMISGGADGTSLQELVASGDQGVCLVSGGKVVASLPPPQGGSVAIDVLVSPNQKVGYVYYVKPDSGKTDGNAFIDLVSLKNDKLEELASITADTITLDDFRGASFSLGGLRFLLPRSNGLAVYDVKSLSQPKLQFLWPVGKVFAADVIHRGQVVCVAMGSEGGECGNF